MKTSTRLPAPPPSDPGKRLTPDQRRTLDEERIASGEAVGVHGRIRILPAGDGRQLWDLYDGTKLIGVYILHHDAVCEALRRVARGRGRR